MIHHSCVPGVILVEKLITNIGVPNVAKFVIAEVVVFVVVLAAEVKKFEVAEEDGPI